jgi:hypothetical protein
MPSGRQLVERGIMSAAPWFFSPADLPTSLNLELKCLPALQLWERGLATDTALATSLQHTAFFHHSLSPSPNMLATKSCPNSTYGSKNEKRKTRPTKPAGSVVGETPLGGFFVYDSYRNGEL